MGWLIIVGKVAGLPDQAAFTLRSTPVDAAARWRISMRGDDGATGAAWVAQRVRQQVLAALLDEEN